jgi:peptidyl-prolyl cis-trans isomerase C
MKLVLAAATIALLAWMPATAHAQDDANAETEVVATVNGDAITRADVVTAILALPPEYQDIPMEYLWQPILDQIIDRKLIAAAARDQGLDQTEAYQDEMALIEEEVLQQMYMQARVDEEMTDEAVQAAYDAWLVEYHATGLGDEVHARHILLGSEEEAAAVAERAQAGEDFAELAKELSIGPSGVEGGDLGWFRYGDMVAEFADAAYALQAGEISGPVQSPFGWHVIKMEERRPLEPPTLEEVEIDLRDTLARDAILAELDALREGADVVIMEPAPASE